MLGSADKTRIGAQRGGGVAKQRSAGTSAAAGPHQSGFRLGWVARAPAGIGPFRQFERAVEVDDCRKPVRRAAPPRSLGFIRA